MNYSSETENDDTMSDINMTPLVDVMLVLLIIFIITVPVITHSVKIDLPEASSSKNIEKPDTITISVDKNANIFWNEDKIDHEELTKNLAMLAIKEPQPDIQLKGAKKVDYEHIIKIMSATQQAGINTLGFVTAPENN